MTSPSTPVSEPVELVEPYADLRDSSMIREFPEGVRLVGAHCKECGLLAIGERSVCSACVGRDVEVVPLAPAGVLYSYTVLHVGVDGSRAMGYIDLNDGVRVLSTLRGDATMLRPDAPVELASDGDDWWFALARASAKSERQDS